MKYGEMGESWPRSGIVLTSVVQKLAQLMGVSQLKVMIMRLMVLCMIILFESKRRPRPDAYDIGDADFDIYNNDITLGCCPLVRLQQPRRSRPSAPTNGCCEGKKEHRRRCEPERTAHAARSRSLFAPDYNACRADRNNPVSNGG